MKKIEQESKNKRWIFKLTLSAMFMAIGYFLPFLTGQIPEIGKMLLPMHIPVLLCGLICGWQYGLVLGCALPLTRCLIFGTPIFYPSAISMAFELATYGFVVGMLYSRSKWKCVFSLYRSMFIAMIAGRAVMGLANLTLHGVKGNVYSLTMFLSGAFLNAVPGIILQLILIPAIMIALNKTGAVKFTKKRDVKSE